uniref:C-type lectin domain-containing protein n=1 Tax=Echeneis naucrates TaxID=173247 RepID=A0A665UEP1_ECHNA
MISFVFRCSYEQSHFTVALAGKSGFWWIGLRAHGGITGGVDYVWDNGASLSFTHWDREQPGRNLPPKLNAKGRYMHMGQTLMSLFVLLDSGDGTCVAMTTGQVGGFWDDKQCSEEYAFICEKSRPDITPPTNPPTPPPEEEEFLSTYTKGSSKWIGLKHNPTEGGEDNECYSWSDGTPLSHTNWGSGEPNNHDNREECVEMVSSTNGTISWWNDLNCDYICKITSGTTLLKTELSLTVIF